MDNQQIIIRVATQNDKKYSTIITDEMESSAKARGTGIAKRSPEYIEQKIDEGKAVIALTPEGEWVGFCYIETWSHGEYVANSGLIVAPEFRKSGVAKRIKQKIFALSREKYPDAKIFGLTTGLAVMKINSDLGYEPVTYSELTNDEEFWKGCQSCVNYDILMSKGRKNCMCTAMLYDPVEKAKDLQLTPLPRINAQRQEIYRRQTADNLRLFERWTRLKEFLLMKGLRKRLSDSQDKDKGLLGLLFFW